MRRLSTEWFLVRHRPATETHELAERKLKELERLREAWGIQEDAVEGAAFDQDLQVSTTFSQRHAPGQETLRPIHHCSCHTVVQEGFSLWDVPEREL